MRFIDALAIVLLSDCLTGVHKGLLARPVNLLGDASAGAEAKSAATRAYASQIALFKADLLTDLHAPESYWQLQYDTAPLPTYSMSSDRVASLV